MHEKEGRTSCEIERAQLKCSIKSLLQKQSRDSFIALACQLHKIKKTFNRLSGFIVRWNDSCVYSALTMGTIRQGIEII